MARVKQTGDDSNNILRADMALGKKRRYATKKPKSNSRLKPRLQLATAGVTPIASSSSAILQVTADATDTLAEPALRRITVKNHGQNFVRVELENDPPDYDGSALAADEYEIECIHNQRKLVGVYANGKVWKEMCYFIEYGGHAKESDYRWHSVKDLGDCTHLIAQFNLWREP